MCQFAAKDKPAAVAPILSWLAIGCALIFFLLLGFRQQISFDLGYHLAFGETFFETGKIVDHTPFIYTLPPPNAPAAERPAPGPGNWYDSAGNYRFPNSNWLSQLFIYGAWVLDGAMGLTLLQILILAGLALALITVMRRNRIPYSLIALSLLLLGILVDMRLNMRPEIFGYLCLILHYLMLSKLAYQTDDTPVPPSMSWIAGMVAIQLLCVNLHSFFLLNLAITGAVLSEYILYALKIRLIDKDVSRFKLYQKIVSRLGLTLTAMALACFLNPWGWRLALLPFQTLLYLKKYRIGGALDLGEHAHPWDSIVELRGTISEHWPALISDYAVLIMLILVAAAFMLQLIAWARQKRRLNDAGEIDIPYKSAFRVRWAHLFMIAGLLFVGLQVRRNIGVASLIVIPSALFCITDSFRSLPAVRISRFGSGPLIGLNLAVIALSIFGGYQVVNGKLFEADRLPARIGIGISDTMLPIGAANWLNRFAPDARVWSDFTCSSTLRFFTRPHTDLPVLTNTWAAPPDVLKLNQLCSMALIPFGLLADHYHVEAVVLRADWSPAFHRELATDPDWKMVHIEGVFVLYLRAHGRYGALAASHEIRTDNFDVNLFATEEIAKDPSFNRALLGPSNTLHEAGQLDLAIDLIEAGLRYLPPNLTVWETLMNLYGERGERRQATGDKRFLDDGRRLNQVMQKILELEPAYFNMQH